MFLWVPKVPALGQRKLAEEVPPALGAGALWIVMVRWNLEGSDCEYRSSMVTYGNMM